MPLTKEFLSFWKKNYNVLSVPLFSLILFAIEEIMEFEFKCPEKKSLRILYVFSYFFCPAFIIFFLSLTSSTACIPCAHCSRKFSCCQRSEIIFKAILPSLIWCVILLCDGRYINCVTSGNKTQNATQSPAAAAALSGESFMMSQVAGLVMLALVVCLYGVCYVWPLWFCCDYEEEHQREELETLLEENLRTLIEEKKKEGVEQITEQKVKPSLQLANFWENRDFRNTEKKIKEVVQFAVRATGEVRQQAAEQSVSPTSYATMTTHN